MDNQLEFFQANYHGDRTSYGSGKDAEKELKYALENSDDKNWQIFWINTNRDGRRTPESVRVDIKCEGIELERLKETDYAAWVDLKNDC